MILQKTPIKDNNPNYPLIPAHPYRMLITVVSISGKTNEFFNRIKQQNDDDFNIIDKNY